MNENMIDQLRNGAPYLVGILGAVGVLVFGWLIARLMRRAARAAANALNRFLARHFSVGSMAAVRISPSMITLLAGLVFWLVLAVAATLAMRIAGLDMITQWLDRVALYLPNLVAALAIVIVGFLVSVFVREHLTPDSDAHGQLAWRASLAQALIIIVALIIALDQIGIEVGLLIVLAVVVVAGGVFTLGATLAMGARQYAANLVGIRTARTQLSAGQWLRVDDIEGQIVELSATQIVLDTAQGRVLLPGYFFDAKVATILSRGSNDEP